MPTARPYSANLGFLWTELALPDAVRAAAAAGFAAVELHWPYDVPAAEVAAVLKETGLSCMGLNTVRGDVAGGENGLAALPGREDEARAAIDQAFAYGAAIGAANVHVMGGCVALDEGLSTFTANLAYACERAEESGIGVVIEPLNRFDVPGYAIHTIDDGLCVLDALGRREAKLMFDCYHVAREGCDVVATFSRVRDRVGHVQFAGVPDRGPPDRGTVDYAAVLPALRRLGWSAPFGAEYRPDGPTDGSLAWLDALETG